MSMNHDLGKSPHLGTSSAWCLACHEEGITPRSMAAWEVWSSQNWVSGPDEVYWTVKRAFYAGWITAATEYAEK
jgi:hypothetical protein